MRILISGSSGFIGSALVPFLQGKGHQVTRLVRGGSAGEEGIRWDPATGAIDQDRLPGIHAVVHLAGESVVGRWTPQKKAAIRKSRVEGTRRLVETLARVSPAPSVLICASATGFYGDRGDERLSERSAPGAGFLADVCREWESAANAAEQHGMRVVTLRIGMVLDRSGGALGKMLVPFQLGLGGRLGSGRQYWSWIAREDLLGAIGQALASPALEGPVNVVAPQAVTNEEFTRALGRILGRPTIFPVPAAGIRLLMGEMGDGILLASQRVEPHRLRASGYAFQYPELEGALRRAVGGGS
jgi:uncharacterized protein (TIGR01777 family)